MAEPERPWPPGRFSDRDLAGALSDLDAHLSYPAAPHLAQSVRARLEMPPAPRRPAGARGLGLWRNLVLALLALILLAGVTLAASPDIRRAVEKRLGLPGVTIIFMSALPTPSPTIELARALAALGERVTLSQAQAAVSFPLVVPAQPAGAPLSSAPDGIYLAGPSEAGPSGGEVALVYRARPGLPDTGLGVGALVMELRGSLIPHFFGKMVGPGTR